jgi:hypothetical protein
MLERVSKPPKRVRSIGLKWIPLSGIVAFGFAVLVDIAAQPQRKRFLKVCSRPGDW